MSINECIGFAKEHPVCFVATVDGNQPRVRAFMFWNADETGFYFETQKPKKVYEQLKENGRVEVCFFNNGDLQSAKTLRISGEVEFVQDAEMKKRLISEWEFLKPVEDLTEIFRIKTGEAFFWTMNDILKEREIERIKF